MYNVSVTDAAQRVAQQAQRDFFAIEGTGAVVLSAIAGAGKSHFVMDTVRQCGERRMRVAVAAPTNEQAFALVRSIAGNEPDRAVTFIPAAEVALPGWAQRPNVSSVSPAYTAGRHEIVVGTIDKFASALNPMRGDVPVLHGFDALIMDESFQADAGRYYALAAIAPRHLCVGDGGQIRPFTTVEAGRQWRGLAEDPLQTAVDVLRTHHPDTPVHRFPITRRLDSRGALIARCFYPAEHAFDPAVLDGVRRMRLSRAVGGNARERALDQALSLAADRGRAYVELPARQTLVADPDTAQVIADLVGRLRARDAQLVCERNRREHPLREDRIAIGVSHNNQKAMLRVLLAQAGMGGVVVETANKLQGLEFDVVVCWHPLAGLMQADEFHVEAGRMCVLATRHRHACLVVGRDGDRALVEGLPPATPSWPGAQTDDILQGWEIHRNVFRALDPFRVSMP